MTDNDGFVTTEVSDFNKENQSTERKYSNPDLDISLIAVPSKDHTGPSHSEQSGWFITQLTNSCGLTNSWYLQIIGALIIVIVSWCLLYSLLHDEVLPQGDLFKLMVLIISAYIVGYLVGLMNLPPLLGMLITGIVLKTVGFYNISGVYMNIVISLREVALSVILIKAGLGLDPVALLKLSLVVLRLAICPCFGEALAAAVVSHFILGYPWLWGLLLGFMLGAVSPAVVVPTLLSLQERGYGEDKGISTLVIAASSLDDIVAISIFGIFLGMIFSEGEMAHQILQGPLEMVIGLTVGIGWGLLSGLLPHKDDKQVVIKRALMVGLGGLCSVLGSEVVGFSGAGPLICITSSFVACLCWKTQGWTNSHNPVAAVFSNVWLILQPMLFGLIGAEIDLTKLDYGTVGYGVCIIFSALVVRVLVCCLVLLGGKLNFKEIIFVNLAWLPKATVQAALAPEALDLVRRSPNPTEEDLQRGAQVLTIAVLSILLTAPLGSIGISLSGPRLLSNKPSPAKQVIAHKV
uniref:Cation/H+ exchanger transmembrane domain-containing protein n=1 Tax=Clastoptera arizonana TaxID=38151 RepID=A0A1B6E6M0_9HEMI